MRDTVISRMAAGAVTKSLKLATGICLMIERDPITTAKEVATLDSLSNGRVIFGIGGGWNAEEMENHGTRFDRRWEMVRGRVLAMKTIWTEDEPLFHGAVVVFDLIWCVPNTLPKHHTPL